MALTPDQSYVTVEEADAFFADRLDAPAWNSATTEQKEIALKLATRAVDDQPFFGEKTGESQALQWPRDGESAVPDAVKTAECLQAEHLLNDPAAVSRRSAARADGVRSVDLGAFGEDYARGGVGTEMLLCVEARLALHGLVRGQGRFA